MSSKMVPWDAIPDSVGNVLPTNTYKFEIETLEEVQSSKERYMIKGTYRVLEPKSEAGMVLFDNYAIGNEQDPQGDDPKSWEGIAAARFKDLIKKSGVTQHKTVEETCTAARGNMFIGEVTQETEMKEGPYKGQVRNRLKKVYRVGEKDAAQSGVVSGGAKSGATFRPGRVG